MPYQCRANETRREDALTTIPKVLHEHINTAYPAHVCLVGTALPNGYAQITPRGSTLVYDDEHFSLWERGKGSTNASLTDGTKVTIYFRKPPLREVGPAAARRHRALLRHRENLQIGSDLRGDLEPPHRAREEERCGQEGFRRADQGGAGGGFGRSAADDLTALRTRVCSLAPCGGGLGEGGGVCASMAPRPQIAWTPTPNPSPQGEGEHTEFRRPVAVTPPARSTQWSCALQYPHARRERRATDRPC